MRTLRRAWATLTGRRWTLTDRADLIVALRNCGRSGAPFAVVLIGLDRLDEITARYGDKIGDAVQAEVGGKLGDLARGYRGAVAARLRDGEFALLAPSPLPAVSQAWGYEALCAVASVAVDGAMPQPVRASVGVMHAQPGQDPARVLRAADVALDRAKAAGGDAVVESDETVELPTVDDAPAARPRDLATLGRLASQEVGPA